MIATVVSEIRGTIAINALPGTHTTQVTSPVNRPWENFTWTSKGSLVLQQYPKFLILALDATAPSDFAGVPGGMPEACADGKEIVFINELGLAEIDENGANLRQIKSGKNIGFPICSPDSKRIFYVDSSERRTRVMTVALAGGIQRQLSDVAPVSPWLDLSFDGKLLAVDVSAMQIPKWH